MASTIMKKPCAKCSKGVGVATCDGCQQSFCIKHFGEHRQELSHQMDSIGQEHDLLQRDLNQQTVEHPLLSHINTWEQECITKIQVAAEVARADLRKLHDQTSNELRKSIQQLTDEIRSSRETDDYTEIDINKWIQQLKALRQLLESPSNVCVTNYDILQSSIHLIKVYDQQQQCYYPTIQNSEKNISALEKQVIASNEKFDEIGGEVILSATHLVATCISTLPSAALIIYGTNRYSSGVHHIRFRIDKIGNLRIFFGIIASSEELKGPIYIDTNNISLNGWWDLDGTVVNGKIRWNKAKKSFTTGDEVTLKIDCDNRQIQLEHHRTKRSVQLLLDVNKCPFPWKLIIRLRSADDAVRIL